MGPEDIRDIEPECSRFAQAGHQQGFGFRSRPALRRCRRVFQGNPRGFPGFLGTAAAAATSTPDNAMARVAVEKTAPAEPTWHPDLLREIERDLATCIGPMAAIALRRAARQTNDLTALYELLGKHVDNPREHAEFLAKGRRRAAGSAAGGLRPAAPSKPATEDRRKRDRPATSPTPANIASIEIRSHSLHWPDRQNPGQERARKIRNAGQILSRTGGPYPE